MNYRGKWCIFLVTHNMCTEKKTGQFNSVEEKKIFGKISCIRLIDLIASGRNAWQEEGETRKSSSTVSILQEQLYIFELFGTFRTQSYYWSFVTVQCYYSQQLLPVHISCKMCVQFPFYHQFGIDIWRSKFEQKTDSILSVCGSYGSKSRGSRCDRLEVIVSCTIPAISMEKTKEHGVLGRHQSCSKKRTEVQSGTIECNLLSKNTSSIVYSESF